MLDLYIQHNIRQSDEWKNYFFSVGWEARNFGSSNGFYVMRNIGPIKIAKLQRASLSENDLVELDERCKRDRVLFLKIEPNLNADIDLLEKFGYIKSDSILSPPATILHDLTDSLDNIYAESTQSAKYSINRAVREGCTVKILSDPDRETLLNYYNEILKPTSKTQKFFLPKFDVLYKHQQSFKDKNYLAFVYDKDNNVLGARIILRTDKIALYLNGGTTPLGRNSKGGFLLVWEIIKFLKSQNVEIIDWEGIEDPRFKTTSKSWKGFSEFKYKFGGQKIYFPEPYIKFFNPLLNSFNKKFKVFL